MEHDPLYTVTLRGRDFSLTKSQIEFDGPNYFTACFLGDFKEAQTRRLVLPRDPDIFFVVCDYLCGYKVLPLSSRVIPARMTPELALENLKADAEFYGLDGLFEQCNALLAPSVLKAQEKSRKPYSVVGCQYQRDIEGPFADELDLAIRAPTWITRITEANLTEEPFASMSRPDDKMDYLSLSTRATVEAFAREVCGGEFKLVGWYLEAMSVVAPFKTRLMVVLED
ncbi:unnamed protein product [Rhizoctonia solani]|uniref:BTB domain-containing protein n=1 Tax=Rhizoctonia solani TaxID=456999 RepID=A0A8H3DZB0_9AGAM|nr:unnamed protein product [Rhizoctonia solani]